MEVKLPEEGVLEAWKRLVQMDREQKLLGRDISVVDLRLPDRLFVKTRTQPQPMQKTALARET